MARVRRTKEQIINDKIAVIDQTIDGIQEKIDAAQAEKADLQAQLDEIEAVAAKAAEEETLKAILSVMKEKGLSPAELFKDGIVSMNYERRQPHGRRIKPISVCTGEIVQARLTGNPFREEDESLDVVYFSTDTRAWI